MIVLVRTDGGVPVSDERLVHFLDSLVGAVGVVDDVGVVKVEVADDVGHSSGWF